MNFFIFFLFLFYSFCDVSAVFKLHYEGADYESVPCPFMNHRGIYLEKYPGYPAVDVYSAPSFESGGNEVVFSAGVGNMSLDSEKRISSDFKIGGLFLDSAFRDAKKTGGYTYFKNGETIEKKLNGAVVVYSEDEVYNSPIKGLVFSKGSFIEGRNLRILGTSIHFQKNLFRLEGRLVLECPSHLNSAIRKIEIIPETFSYDDQREGKEEGPHMSRTFFLDGSIDFFQGVHHLTALNAKVIVHTMDLRYFRRALKVKKETTEESKDLSDLFSDLGN